MMVVMVGAVLAGELSRADPPSSTRLVADATVGVLACLAMPLVHRRPVGGAAALGALSALVPTAAPLAATAVLWVAGRHRLGGAAATAAGAVAAQVARDLWRPDVGLARGWWLLVVTVSYAAILGWGAWVQARRALVGSLVERARQAERARIAREMHDTLAHRLSLVATFAGALEYNPAAPPEQVTQATGAIRAAAHQALEELREVIGVLRDDRPGGDRAGADGVERPQPTFLDLETLVEEGRATGADIALDNAVAPADRAIVPAGLGRTAYRIVQEALTNARKHAPGQAVQVAVQGRPGARLEIEVVNPISSGRRPAPPPGSGTGLAGLRERVELCGGRFEHGTAAPQRYRVGASMPWPA